MEIIRHSEWADTKLTLHLVSQILGKIKLGLAPQEPQWAHVTLPLTVNGFSTGPLWSGETLFEIDVDVAASVITVQVETATTVIPLTDGKPIKSYYEAMVDALHASGITVTINPKSQEMHDIRWLDRDETPLVYDALAAQEGVRLFQYAAREQAAFLAPLRCRKVKPALFWGTFDVSSLIVYGKFEPFPEDKVIEKAAFDEHMIEFGFWLGDESVDVPTFFILPYPFQYTDLGSERLQPEDAYYDAEMSECFLSIENVSRADDIQAFFRTSFDLLSDQLGWEGRAHYFLPLDMRAQPKQEPTDESL
ncbi:DUF5996 family protein [Exiguobacterium sp. s28]|uniref:DUF5996 family protein n=1 Tax=Exiguobacterium sp. s28 TaxID=2751238 RepID=UPI001BE5FEFE|nr:DUF5996 family protein [Exiguobacterium sp. s28]